MSSGRASIVGCDWDAVIIGAGPGGALAARELARRGRSVLLVEKQRFPRWKVCGACLGRAGVGTLERCGLGGLLGGVGARPVRATRLVWRGRCVRVPMRGMVAVSRRALDTALVGAARDAGAVFLEGERARVGDDGSVAVGNDTIACRSVVLAAGLRSAGRDGEDGARVAPGSWIGLGATGPADGLDAVPVDELVMAVGSRGYAGCVITEDGLANWAAAVEPGFVRASGSPGAAVRAICEESGLDASPPAGGWVGTPALTRCVPVQRGALYRVGDAAGYVEPITGEGMSWALLGAEAVSGVIDRTLRTRGRAGDWSETHASLFRFRRARCRVVSRALRSPTAMRCAFGVLSAGSARRSGLVERLIGGHV